MRDPAKYLLWLCLTSALFSACSGSSPKEYRKTSDINSILGQKYVFPHTPDWKLSGKDTTIFLTEGVKLVVFIRESSCTPCSLKEFRHWKPILKELDSLKAESRCIHAVFIVSAGGDDPNIVRTLQELQFDHPVMFDRKKEFEKNNLLPLNTMINCFLLDKKDKVIWVGNPLIGRNGRELFRQTIEHKTRHSLKPERAHD